MRKGRISRICPSCSWRHQKDGWLLTLSRGMSDGFVPPSQQKQIICDIILWRFFLGHHTLKRKDWRYVRLYLIYNHPSLTKCNAGTCDFLLLSVIFINLCRCIMSVMFQTVTSASCFQIYFFSSSAGLSLIKHWVKTVRPLLLCMIARRCIPQSYNNNRQRFPTYFCNTRMPTERVNAPLIHLQMSDTLHWLLLNMARWALGLACQNPPRRPHYVPSLYRSSPQFTSPEHRGSGGATLEHEVVLEPVMFSSL